MLSGKITEDLEFVLRTSINEENVRGERSTG